jgi:hypothetical protein
MSKKKLFTALIVASIAFLNACESKNAKPDTKPIVQKKSSVRSEGTQQKVVTPAQEAATTMKDVIPPVEQSKAKMTGPSAPKTKVKAGSDPRMGYVSKLIYGSKAAQQIMKSQNNEAKKLYQKSQNLYQSALKESSPVKSKVLLDKALKNMFAATQKANPSEIHDKKLRNDFTKKKKTVSSLLDAHNRVSLEKNKISQGKQVKKQISLLLKQADILYKKADYAQGKGILDGALNIVKTSIEEMRGGDTLVKTLEFDSPEEEYIYELDRNDTHKMLIKVLLKDKRKKSPDLDKRVKETLIVAEDFRQQAKKAASSGNYKGAVDFLEQSTKEMVKVIRRGGIYIPSA